MVSALYWLSILLTFGLVDCGLVAFVCVFGSEFLTVGEVGLVVDGFGYNLLVVCEFASGELVLPIALCEG